MSYPPFRQSFTKTILSHSLAELRYREDNREPPTPAMSFGTAVHATTLGSDKVLTPIPFASYTGKAAKVLRDEALAAGHNIILERDLEALSICSAKARETIERLTGAALPSLQCEVKHKWNKMTGIVDCRQVTAEKSWTIELKVTGDPTVRAFTRRRRDLYYDAQAAAYVEQSEHQHPHLARHPFTWVVVGSEAPHHVCVYHATPKNLHLGRLYLNKARTMYRDAVKRNDWSGQPEMTCEPTDYEMKELSL